MINGLEGIPGSGKSYEAVVYHVLPMLQQGRRVITNLPLLVEMFGAIDPAFVPLIELRRRPKPVLGVWNADSMDDSGNGSAFKLFNEHSNLSEVVHAVDRANRPAESVSVFGHVWDYFTTWKHPETGQGAVFIIDECHLALPAVGTDKEVIEFFKLHRHFNVSVRPTHLPRMSNCKHHRVHVNHRAHHVSRDSPFALLCPPHAPGLQRAIQG